MCDGCFISSSNNRISIKATDVKSQKMENLNSTDIEEIHLVILNFFSFSCSTSSRGCNSGAVDKLFTRCNILGTNNVNLWIVWRRTGRRWLGECQFTLAEFEDLPERKSESCNWHYVSHTHQNHEISIFPYLKNTIFLVGVVLHKPYWSLIR